MSTPDTTQPNHRTTVKVLRGFLLVALLLGLVGTGAELLLVGHTEGVWQWIPLVLILAALLILGWHAITRCSVSLRVFQVAMILSMAGGVAGLILHYQGKVEFKREGNPSLAGFELFREAMKGAMPPALAPGSMIQFGLLGLAYSYRHPALTTSLHNDNHQPAQTS